LDAKKGDYSGRYVATHFGIVPGGADNSRQRDRAIILLSRWHRWAAVDQILSDERAGSRPGGQMELYPS